MIRLKATSRSICITSCLVHTIGVVSTQTTGSNCNRRDRSGEMQCRQRKFKIRTGKMSNQQRRGSFGAPAYSDSEALNSLLDSMMPRYISQGSTGQPNDAPRLRNVIELVWMPLLAAHLSVSLLVHKPVSKEQRLQSVGESCQLSLSSSVIYTDIPEAMTLSRSQ